MGYGYRMFAATCAFAAAMAATIPLPPGLAAPFSMIVSMIWTQAMDPVQNRFRTDADRILKPNQPTMILISLVVIFSMGCAAWLSNMTGPAIAAVVGLCVCALVSQRMMQ